MKTLPESARLLPLAILLLAIANTTSAANAPSIYKCSIGGKVQYTDLPCVGQPGEVVHQASDTEIIDQYLDLGQDDDARGYADSRDALPLYRQRLGLRDKRLESQTQQPANAARSNPTDAAVRQQGIVDAASSRDRLQGENDAFLRQNATQINQLAQPVTNVSGASYSNGGNGSARSARGQNYDYDRGSIGGGGRITSQSYGAPVVLQVSRHDHDHDHDHDHGSEPAPPPTAVFTGAH